MNDLPPIYRALEPKIAPVVEALRRDGFRTAHSADSGGFLNAPWVVSEYREWPRDLYADVDDFERLLDWLEDHNIDGNVCEVTVVAGGERHSYLRIEILSDISEAHLGAHPLP